MTHPSLSVAVVLEQAAKKKKKEAVLQSKTPVRKRKLNSFSTAEITGNSNLLNDLHCPLSDSVLFYNLFSTLSLIISRSRTSNTSMDLDSIAKLCMMSTEMFPGAHSKAKL